MNSNRSLVQDYSSRFKKIFIVSVAALALTITVCLLSLSVSQYPLSLTEAYQLLIDHINGATYDRTTQYELWLKDKIVWEQNLPRLLCAIFVGATLAVGGSIMQSTIQNPLADPYTTGIASGALFGVSLFMIAGFSLPLGLSGDAAMMASAYVFAMVPTLIIAFVTVFRKTPLSPTSMILAGIGTMYFFSAGSSILRFSADANVAQSVFEWTLGSLGRVTLDELPVVILACAAILFFSVIYHKQIDALSEGTNVAISLGVNPKRLRLLSLTIVSICTATVVCYVGTIGFIGLVCPHIARALVGTISRYLIPASAIIGAFMLLVCDTIAKTIAVTGLPVGVITSAIGAPIFVLILIKQKKQSF